jgi:CRISPR-associated protein Cas6
MTTAGDLAIKTVDVVFPIDGSKLPRNNAFAIQEALLCHLPWLADEAIAGIHPVKLVAGVDSEGLLTRRSRLLVRINIDRFEALGALAGLQLDVMGSLITLGTPHPRALVAHGTLYAYRVASESADEVQFMAQIQEELGRLGIAGEAVCGKRQEFQVSPGCPAPAFSLMLHGLHPAQSLRLQQQGLGPHRLLGCGVFVPHKSAAAVGL